MDPAAKESGAPHKPTSSRGSVVESARSRPEGHCLDRPGRLKEVPTNEDEYHRVTGEGARAKNRSSSTSKTQDLTVEFFPQRELGWGRQELVAETPLRSPHGGMIPRTKSKLGYRGASMRAREPGKG